MPKTIFGGEHRHLVEVLKNARQRAAITQEELATRLGKDQTFISIIERGQRRVDVIEFLALAKAMNADPFDLLKEVSDRTKNRSGH